MMTSRWSQRREQLRAALDANRCIHPGSVFDPISARIAHDLGFEAGIFAGSIASLTVLGAPDLIVLTLSEFAEQAYRINRAAPLPLLVDADHGYGNALNVMRTVEELENAGVAALSIEDTELPQSFGPSTKTRLISIDEGVGKMRAAIAARHDSALVIAGRTSARAAADFDEVIIRIQAYEAAGVDAVFVVGVETQSQLAAIGAAVKVPVILGGVSADLIDLDELSRHGVKICLQSHQPFMAAVQAIYDTLSALKNGVQPAAIDTAASPQMMKKYSHDSIYQRWLDDFLKPPAD